METERRRILLEQGVRTLVRHGYPRFIRLALRIISSGFGHRGMCVCVYGGRGCAVLIHRRVVYNLSRLGSNIAVSQEMRIRNPPLFTLRSLPREPYLLLDEKSSAGHHYIARYDR